MGKFSILILSWLLASGAGANSGAWLTGDELLRTCEDKKNDYKQGLCVFYGFGAADGTTIWELWKDLSSNICISGRGEMGDLVDVVVEHLHANPQDLHFDASSVVLNALITTFPCSK